MSESQHTEWKESWRDEYLKWVCAFANSEGGVLLIDKSDQGAVKNGYIDTRGRGTLKIYKACAEARLPEPQIIEKNGGIEVTLFKAVASEKDQNDFGTILEQIRNNFGTSVDATFKVISENPELTTEQISTIIGKSVRSVKSYISRLKDANFIERVGPTIGGYWKIKEKD